MTKRKPATVGEILAEEFMELMGLTQQALADAMGVQRKHVNQLCCSTMNADWHRASIDYALQNVSAVSKADDVIAALG
jgi:addiction module HigA family antidote